MSNTRKSSGGARTIGNQTAAYWDAERFPVKQGWVARKEEAPVFTPSKDMICAATPAEQMAAGARHHMATATKFVKPKEAKDGQ